jgi:hypothetical protein
VIRKADPYRDTDVIDARAPRIGERPPTAVVVTSSGVVVERLA